MSRVGREEQSANSHNLPSNLFLRLIFSPSFLGSPGWGFGPDPAWPGGSGMYGGRRRSAVSDSGDTGIGTLCSDSLEGRTSFNHSDGFTTALWITDLRL